MWCSFIPSILSIPSTFKWTDTVWLNVISGLWLTSHCIAWQTYSHLHLHFLSAMQAPTMMKEKKIHASKPTNPRWAKLLECNGEKLHRLGFMPRQQESVQPFLCCLTGQIMLRYQLQPRKRITCVQIELSVWKLKMQSFPWEG